MRKTSDAEGPVLGLAGPRDTSRTSKSGVTALLARLRSSDAQTGWEEFLLQYSAILYQAVRVFTRDEDEASDCFVYICEQLAKNGCRRLLQFKSDGAASFSTWLRVVTRNLWHDWRRKKHGRLRPFKSVQNLSTVELEVYRCRFERGLSREETLQQLDATWPTVRIEELANIESRIENSLSSRQHWLLNTWKQRDSSTSISDAEEKAWEEGPATPDAVSNPETIAVNRQEQSRLQKYIGLLLPIERLIVRLRFEDDLSLDEISQLTGLGDAQRVHRRLAGILQKLRAEMGARRDGKTGGRVREIRQETR